MTDNVSDPTPAQPTEPAATPDAPSAPTAPRRRRRNLGDPVVEKPRLFQGMRDILLTLGVLLLVTFFLVGTTGMCSFNPGAPEAKGPVVEVDTTTVLKMDAKALNLPLRDPEMPEDWVANSVRRVRIGQETSPLVGWVIDGEQYISLTQTRAQDKDIITHDGQAREATDSFTAGGLTWQAYEGEDARPMYIADVGLVRLVLTSMASEENVRIAAERTALAKPINEEPTRPAAEASATTTPAS